MAGDGAGGGGDVFAEAGGLFILGPGEGGEAEFGGEGGDSLALGALGGGFAPFPAVYSGKGDAETGGELFLTPTLTLAEGVKDQGAGTSLSPR